MRTKFNCSLLNGTPTLNMSIYIENRRKIKLFDFIASCRWDLDKRFIFDLMSGEEVDKDYYATEMYTMRINKKSQEIEIYNPSETILYEKVNAEIFKRIVDQYLKELEKFGKNNLDYIRGMLERGGSIIVYDEYSNEINRGKLDRYKADLEVLKSYVIVRNKEEKLKLEKLLEN